MNMCSTVPRPFLKEMVDVFKGEDFILTRKNGFYNFTRSNSEGVIIKPVEDIIKKNLNQLFENLLN